MSEALARTRRAVVPRRLPAIELVRALVGAVVSGGGGGGAPVHHPVYPAGNAQPFWLMLRRFCMSKHELPATSFTPATVAPHPRNRPSLWRQSGLLVFSVPFS